ncbi:unnamed protein product [Arabidopsis lyrata]|uniref:uncharacterized protein LOC110227643 n=1 Tax=Arabidopsis lyrata subsp. lyrata TaxID=81972 RepID=UPI000A29B4FA|nr:uncharacterized protein LOC110227643 [Arabidopsis lyrata subsp. lyrata]CAH8271769.1 unnamed protein product [Arabidopsis lyrata]|eukprot:XP_020878228.1 uncharacterized protein LOC110227643 [Arabidopsis lyrata subsp. lyrata]
MAAIQILDQVDDSADSLIESMRGVQNTMALLHSTVGDLLNSMAETLKSMAEMKSALLLQPPTEPSSSSSQVTVNHHHHEDLPAPPKQQLTTVVDNSIDGKDKSRVIHLKKVQVEMPVFEGLNVNSWILRAERYFGFGSFTETEKIRLAYMSVQGPALSWFNLCENRNPFVDWHDFKSRLLQRFGDFRSVMERFLSLKQVDSVIVYLGEFEELSSQCLDVPDSLLEAVFVKGLKDEIQEMLRVFPPKGLRDIIMMARRLENSAFCRVIKNSQLTDSEFEDLSPRRNKLNC